MKTTILRQLLSILFVTVLAGRAEPLVAFDLDYLTAQSNVPANIPLHPYYFVHSVRTYALIPLGLNLTPEQTGTLLPFMFTNMSFQTPNIVAIPNFRKSGHLRISFRLQKNDSQVLFLIYTNYDPKTDTVREGPIDERFGAGFYVSDSRLVYSANKFSPAAEERIIQSGSRASLAEFYLFDGLSEHLRLVSPLLDQTEKDPSSTPHEKCRALVVRVQRTMIIQDDIGSAAAAIPASICSDSLPKGPQRDEIENLLNRLQEEMTIVRLYRKKIRTSPNFWITAASRLPALLGSAPSSAKRLTSFAFLACVRTRAACRQKIWPVPDRA